MLYVSVFQEQTKHWSIKRGKIYAHPRHLCILQMIIKNMRPLADMEGQGFCEMINRFHSGYTLLF